MRVRRGRLRAAGSVLAIAALVLVGDACAMRAETAVERVLTAPPALPLPAAGTAELLPPPVVHATPHTPEPLPVPIIIPLDSYADEPVVEYGWIEIPKIGLSHQLFQGVTLHNIDHGPSHWTGTATPGQPGNAVFAGHRVTRTRPFRWIDELEVGDSVIFTVGAVRSEYRVTDSLVVGPEDTWIANQTAEPTATLYACHPPGSAAQRYVVQMSLLSTGAAPA